MLAFQKEEEFKKYNKFSFLHKKEINNYQCFVKKLQENKTTCQILNFFIFFHFQLGEIYPSQERIARQVKKTTRTVRNAIKRLEELGILYKQGRSKLKTCIYALDLERLKVLVNQKKVFRLRPVSSYKETDNSSFQPKVLQDKEKELSTEISGEISTEVSAKYTYSNNFKSISSCEKSFQKFISKNKSVRKTENKENVDLLQETKRLIAEAKIIWEEEVEGKISFPKLTSYFIKSFLTSFQKLFKNSLDEFREYCRKIASSKFLMGEKSKFQAWFSWLIKPETYERIFSGEFDIGDRVPSKMKQQFQKNAKEQKEKELEKKYRERIIYEATLEVRRKRNQKLLEAEEFMTKEEKESLKNSFEELLISGKHSLSKFFKETGWDTPFINIMFSDYKKEIILEMSEEEHIQKIWSKNENRYYAQSA